MAGLPERRGKERKGRKDDLGEADFLPWSALRQEHHSLRDYHTNQHTYQPTHADRRREGKTER